MGKAFVLHSMKMQTKVSKEELLKALLSNRETHAKIVAEARNGYVDQAKAALERRLEEVRKGKIVSLSFSLSPPLDYTEAYDTAIKMVQMHQDDHIVLEPQEFRCLVMDEWDWTSSFIGSTKGYSGLANEYANSKGID